MALSGLVFVLDGLPGGLKRSVTKVLKAESATVSFAITHSVRCAFSQ